MPQRDTTPVSPLYRYPVKRRFCLRCKKAFYSEGDRICRKCNEINKTLSKWDDHSVKAGKGILQRDIE